MRNAFDFTRIIHTAIAKYQMKKDINKNKKSLHVVKKRHGTENADKINEKKNL